MRKPQGSGSGVQTVIAAQQGDEQAMADLLAEYLPLIYNIVGRAMNGHADADDVVQETMLRAVRNIGDLRDPAAFRSWLVAVAIRQVRDYVAALGTQPRDRISEFDPHLVPRAIGFCNKKFSGGELIPY